MSNELDMNGVFAINKPTGVTSAQFLARLQQFFTSSSVFSKDLAQLRGAKVEQLQKEGQRASRRKLRKVMKVKMGHGGTLDPLATGVLVVGVGKGTKQLQNYLSGSVKVYETEALFGASTTTGDVEGEVLTRAGTSHITKKDVEEIKEKFTGHLKQTPPIFAALKMNGKPLYEYAREGLPLPKPIQPREVQVYELEVFDDTLSKDHNYDFLKSTAVDGENMEEKLTQNPTLNDSKLYLSKEYTEKNSLFDEAIKVSIEPATENEKSDGFKAPLLHFKAKVSSGTYIRSLVSDIGRALGSNAYMVKLDRLQQAEWVIGKNVFQIEDFEKRDEQVWGKVLARVFREGGEAVTNIADLFQQAELEHNEFIEKQQAILQEIEVSEVAEAEAQKQSPTQPAVVDAKHNTKKRAVEDDFK